MNGLITSILGAIDNMGNQFVQTVYMSLGGAMGGVFTGMFTIYIAWWGYQILAGKEPVTPFEAAFRLGRVAVIYLFVTQWATFSTTIYVLIQSIPDEVGKVVVGTVARATGNQLSDQSAIPSYLDSLYSAAQDVASQVYTGSFYDIFGALLAMAVLGVTVVFAGICAAAIIAAKIMLLIAVAIAPVWIIMWLFKWSSRIAEGFISLVSYMIIQQILLYGFLGFYMSLLNLAVSTATASGEEADGKLSMVLPLLLVEVIGIYVLGQIPTITGILNGGGFVNTTGAAGVYARTFKTAATGSAKFLQKSSEGRDMQKADNASKSAAQAKAKQNSTP